MTDLAKLIVKLEAQTAAYQKDIERAQGQTKKFKKIAQSSVNGIKTAFAGIAIGVITKKIIDATAKQEQVFAQLEQGIKSTNQLVGFSARELADYASELQNVTTFGDEEIISAQSKLVTFTKITGQEFKRTTELALDMAQRFGGDASAAALQLGKALNDPVANLSALSRAGIQFSNDQKSVIKALVDSGDQVAAQKIILAELEVQFGGSARAARDTFGGALTGLSNAFGDLLESNGGLKNAQAEIEKLTATLSDPQTKKAADELTTVLISGFSTLVGVMAQVPDFAKFIGESIAAAIHGPADLVRVNDELIKKQEELKNTENARAHAVKVNDKLQIDGYNSRIEALTKEIGLLKTKQEIFTPTAPTFNQPKVSGAPTTTQNKEVNPILGDISKWVIESQKQAEKIVASVTPVIEQLKTKMQDAIGLHSAGFLTDEQFEIAKQTYENQISEIVSKENTAFEDRLARLQENFLTEREFLDSLYQEDQDVLEDRRAAELLGEEQFAALKLKIHEDYTKAKTQLEQQQANLQISNAEFAANSVIGILSAFAGKSFKAQKALAIAEGIIAITAGVAKALNNPYPANLGFAAQVAAKGAGLIATIKSTKHNSGGSSPQISGGGGGGFQSPSAINEVQSASQTAAENQQTIKLDWSLKTDDFTEQPMRVLIEKMAATGRDMGLEISIRD